MNHRGVYYTPTCDAIKDPVNKHRELVGDFSKIYLLSAGGGPFFMS